MVQTVNARELHAFLEVGKKFADWVNERIEKYGFVENLDFVVRFPKLGSGDNQQLGAFQPGANRKEYHLTLDMAKELSMVERNARGKQARQYFIECERRLKAQETAASLPSRLPRLQLLEIAIQAEQERLALEHRIEVIQPKADALDRISTAEGSMCISDAAKHLQIQPSRLFDWLSNNKWIFRRSKNKPWVAFQDCIRAGMIEQKVKTIERKDDTPILAEQALITPKGLARLSQIIESGTTSLLRKAVQEKIIH